jgi:hypothetical protein
MKKLMMRVGVAVGVLFLGGSAARAEGCMICNSGQWCESGSGGSSCYIYYDEGGRRWCQFSLECSKAVTMTPLELSAGGTFLAANTVTTSEDGRAVSECNGFITRYSATSPRIQALRI